MAENSTRKQINEWFPRSKASLTAVSITSPKTWNYNCAAWAVGIDNQWLEPSPAGFWPLPHQGVTLDAYELMFAHYGFAVCPDGKYDKALEKIVIYGDNVGNFLHVAKQLPGGKWASKLGAESDITHANPEILMSEAYGSPARYMARPRQNVVAKSVPAVRAKAKDKAPSAD